MPTDKAPGPDGFNGYFFKNCWNIIRNEFLNLCFDFFYQGGSIESINSGLITLIPKVSHPKSMNDYRPISLLNTSIKVITKLLAERLQKVILGLVHEIQYGFIKGRTIQDCLAWSFEYVHQCTQSKRAIIILKLDFEKAFDLVEHNCILTMLECFGFPSVWIQWIKANLSSGSSAVLES